MKKRIISILIIASVLAAVCLSQSYLKVFQDKPEIFDSSKETIRVWYTDEAMTDYLSQASVAFYENTDIRVELKQVSGLEYLEEINKASLDDKENTPDVYVISNDSLEKAYLAGLATQIEDVDQICTIDNYSQVALNSVKYKDKLVAYPLYFETSALIYNKTFLDEIALGSTLEDMGLEEVDDEAKMQAEKKAEEIIPGSIVQILEFADRYTAPENVEYIFKWDVSDIFYNYFFIGNYINVGGSAGDDKSQISIYNQDAIASLKIYQGLNQFFSIEADEVDYETVKKEFLEGKTIFTIATSDMLGTLETAKAKGEFEYEYGVTAIPDMNDALPAKGMSVTQALAINGYSEHKKAANRFATYLGSETSQGMYEKTGKIPAKLGITFENQWVDVYVKEYAESTPVPKMIETSNFWVLLEKTFTKAWSGADVNQELKGLSEQIKKQLTGETFEEEYIEDPHVEVLQVEEYVEGE